MRSFFFPFLFRFSRGNKLRSYIEPLIKNQSLNHGTYTEVSQPQELVYFIVGKKKALGRSGMDKR